MILVSVILFPLLAIIIWLFVRSYPLAQYGEAVRRFNNTTLAIVATSCTAVSLYVWGTIGQSTDRAWWPILALFGSVLVSILVLLVAANVRARLFRGKVAR